MKFNEFINGNGNKIDEYIGWLLASTAYFKSAHLETKSYARHKAYDFYYDAIPALTDKFSEQWLGHSGKNYTANFPDLSKASKDTIEFLDGMVKSSEEIYSKVPKAIQSTIDDIVGVCYQTKYLLSLQ